MHLGVNHASNIFPLPPRFVALVHHGGLRSDRSPFLGGVGGQERTHVGCGLVIQNIVVTIQNQLGVTVANSYIKCISAYPSCKNGIFDDTYHCTFAAAGNDCSLAT